MLLETYLRKRYAGDSRPETQYKNADMLRRVHYWRALSKGENLPTPADPSLQPFLYDVLFRQATCGRYDRANFTDQEGQLFQAMTEKPLEIQTPVELGEKIGIKDTAVERLMSSVRSRFRHREFADVVLLTASKYGYAFNATAEQVVAGRRFRSFAGSTIDTDTVTLDIGTRTVYKQDASVEMVNPRLAQVIGLLAIAFLENRTLTYREYKKYFPEADDDRALADHISDARKVLDRPSNNFEAISTFVHEGFQSRIPITLFYQGARILPDAPIETTHR